MQLFVNCLVSYRGAATSQKLCMSILHPVLSLSLCPTRSGGHREWLNGSVRPPNSFSVFRGESWLLVSGESGVNDVYDTQID